MKDFSFYSSRDIERKWNIWNMSGKIREIVNAFKPFLGTLNVTDSYGSRKTGKKNVI